MCGPVILSEPAASVCVERDTFTGRRSEEFFLRGRLDIPCSIVGRSLGLWTAHAGLGAEALPSALLVLTVNGFVLVVNG